MVLAEEEYWKNVESQMHLSRTTLTKGNFVERSRRDLIRELSTKFGLVCWYCGIPLLTRSINIDHIHPRSRGGTDDIENLALSCSMCNMGKYAYSAKEFTDYLDFVRSSKSVSYIKNLIY